jgi:signal transduction histidine kinase
VRDDGAGIAPGAGGEGLDGLRRRVEDAGGSLTVESSGSGTVIEAKLGDRWVSRDASMESTVSLVETNEPAAEEQS